MSSPPADLVWTPELVNRFWDAVAHSPLQDLSFARVNGRKLLDLLEPHLPRGARVVDVGAGDGDFAGFLMERGYKVAALEPSPERRQALVTRLQGSPHFLGVHASLEGQTFDVAIVMEVIEHVLEPDFKAFLEGVSRAVRPGGLLVVTTPNSENLDYAKVFCPVSNLFFHPWQHQRRFTPRDLEAVWEPYGLTRAYMALVDFSNDAEVYEAFRTMARSEPSTPKEMVNLLSAQQHETGLQLSRLLKETHHAHSPEARVHLSHLAAAVNNQILYQQKVMSALLRAQSLHMETVLPLVSEAAGIQGALREALSHYQRFLCEAGSDREERDALSRSAAIPPAECDLQIGRGGTIIYMARKA